jgi:hypothetical protein
MSSGRAAGHPRASGDFGGPERDERAVRGVDGELHFGAEDLQQLLEPAVAGCGQEGLRHLALVPSGAGRLLGGLHFPDGEEREAARQGFISSLGVVAGSPAGPHP